MKRNYFFLSIILSISHFSLLFCQNSTWYVSENGNGNGSSWATSAHDLQTVIDNAIPGDKIWIKQGTYKRAVGQFFSIKNGVSVYGGFPNTTNPTANDRNTKQYETILEGNGAKVLEAAGIFEPISPATIIDGLTIQNGYAPSGAGISISFCDATFRNLKIINNIAHIGLGAGMNIFNSNSTFIQVLVSNNTSLLTPGNDGDTAGIKITGGETKFYNCVVANNHAQGYIGGIWLNSNTNCHFYNSIIYGNTADLEYTTFTNDNFYALNNVNFYASNCILQHSRGSDFLYEAAQYQIYGIDLGKNLDADPLFNPDFSLQSGSPGINKGNSQAYISAVNSIGTDFFNNNRIIDAIDIGLTEYQAMQSEILYVKPNGTGDGSSWTNASGDLQSMMDKQFEGRSVWVAQGIYHAPNPYFKLRDKIKIYGGFPATGNPTFEDRNTELYPTVLTSVHGAVIGNFYPADKKISSETLLDGFILTKNDNSPQGMLGLFESHSDVSYSNIDFTGFNYGAIEIRRTSNNSFTDCSFTDNHAIDTEGVNYPVTALLVDGAHSSFLRCHFTGNRAFQGSALALIDNSLALVEDCFFTNNSNNSRSGFGKVAYVDNSTATFKNTIFDSNGFSEYGGSILLVTGSGNNPESPWLNHPLQVTIDRCTFKNNQNTALLFQGKPGDEISVSNSLFYKNQGSVGGAIRRHYGGNFYATNCTFTENHASNQWAGGIFMDDGAGAGGDLGISQIRNSIIYNNTSVYTDGPEFWTSRPVQFKNTILRTSGGSTNWDAGLFNDFNIPDMSIDLGGNLDLNPMFLDPANEDFGLSEESQAIDVGDNTLFNPAITPDLSAFAFDLDGNNRIQGNIVDLGAFEFQPLLHAATFEQNSGISIYPNPTESSANIFVKTAAVKEVKVYSILGEELIVTNTQTINLNSFPKGIYIVKVTLANQKSHTTKLIKQ